MNKHMKNSADDILDLLIDLCKIPSITGVPGAENQIPDFLYNLMKKWQYFEENPADLWLEPLKDDILHRNNFCAFVRAKESTKNTIILISHHDVVDTEVFGHLEHLAFNPHGYSKALEEVAMHEDVEADLKSGEWLYGRGVSDMKSGMAAQIGLLSECAANTDKLNANMLLMTLADEENNGFGVHQAVRMLAKMQEEEGLNYLVCIDSEPTITNLSKDSGRIYTGSIGNATLFALCVGKESHVGEYYEGVNAALITSYLVQELEGSDITADEYKGVKYSPATCLKIKDLRELYSVTLLDRVAAAFNVLMLEKSPEDLMNILKDAAKNALDAALAKVNKRIEGMRKDGYESLNGGYETRIITYPELLKAVQDNSATPVITLQKEFLATLPVDMESQDRGIALANYMVDLSCIKGPFVLVGMLSPYCPPRLNRRESDSENIVMSSVNQVIALAKKDYDVEIVHDEIYEGISDMSEMGYQGNATDIDTLTGNLIGWGSDLNHPFEEMKKLNIPVVNLGPIGKDAHKLTERVNLKFFQQVLPNLLRELVENIAQRHK